MKNTSKNISFQKLRNFLLYNALFSFPICRFFLLFLNERANEIFLKNCDRQSVRALTNKKIDNEIFAEGPT